MTFQSFNLHPSILEALTGMGFEKPSPVQEKAIPLILGRKDLIALAETGSGKTAACAIPLCHEVDVSHKAVQVVVVVPTRELAVQYANETQRIGRSKGVKTLAVFGGSDIQRQIARLKGGIHFLVATPGRLNDLIRRKKVNLRNVKTVVLDEADEMLSMGFLPDLNFIFDTMQHDHQTLLFSATMPKGIKKIAGQYMTSPEELHLLGDKPGPDKIEHKFVYVPSPGARPQVLLGLISEMGPNQSLIFCESRRQTEQVCKAMREEMDSVEFLHGGLSQRVRTRLTTKFREGKIRHMVATDVAARGLDFSGVTHVFIYQLGRTVETYVHRSGRTGRSGREGTAVTLVTNQEIGMCGQVAKRIQCEPSWIGAAPPPRGERRASPGRPNGPSRGRPGAHKPGRPGASKARGPGGPRKGNGPGARKSGGPGGGAGARQSGRPGGRGRR